VLLQQRQQLLRQRLRLEVKLLQARLRWQAQQAQLPHHAVPELLPWLLLLVALAAGAQGARVSCICLSGSTSSTSNTSTSKVRALLLLLLLLLRHLMSSGVSCEHALTGLLLLLLQTAKLVSAAASALPLTLLALLLTGPSLAHLLLHLQLFVATLLGTRLATCKLQNMRHPPMLLLPGRHLAWCCLRLWHHSCCSVCWCSQSCCVN
jgi:hypothetical protein